MQDMLVDLGWKSALIAGAVLIAYQALRRRPASERVWMLRLGIGALLALPLVALFAPSLDLAVLPAEEAVAMAVPIIADTAPMAVKPEAPDTPDLILMLYFAGAAIVLLRLILGLFTLWRWTRTAVPVTDPHWLRALARAAAGIGRPVRLLVSRKVYAPLSWGLAPAWILIGPEAEARGEQAQAVIAHEMAHVRRFDWPMLMLAQMVAAMLWFNPLVWWLARALAAQIELAADEEAVGQVARLDYAETLLAVGAGSAHPSACGMTYARATLGQRIRGVLEAAPQRPANRVLCAAMLIVAMATAGPLAMLRFVPVAAQAAPAPALDEYIPAITPEAQAVSAAVQTAPKPEARRKRKAPGFATAAPTRLVETAAAAPANPIPVTSPEPVAPTASASLKRGSRWEQTQAAIERHAALEARRVVRAAELERRLAAEVEQRLRVSPVERDRALRTSETANSMRNKARILERIAADPATPRDVRNEHIRVASRLRRAAQTMDYDARQMIKL